MIDKIITAVLIHIRNKKKEMLDRYNSSRQNHSLYSCLIMRFLKIKITVKGMVQVEQCKWKIRRLKSVARRRNIC